MIQKEIIGIYECLSCGTQYFLSTPFKISQYRHQVIRFNKPDECGCGNKTKYKLLDLRMKGKNYLKLYEKLREERRKKRQEYGEGIKNV